MSARDRAERQRAADAASKTTRLSNLAHDLGFAVALPGSPAVGEPLPKLTVTPSRIYAEPINFDNYSMRGSLDELVRELNVKLAAEDARLRRLLPTAPDGFEWRGEVSSSTEPCVADFTTHETIRLRYRLVAIAGE